MFIELHLIQNFAPSNLNRDDTNSPKDCEFGGHRRARISSQSLKRAIRFEPIFAETTAARNGERSKWLTRPIKQRLLDAGKSEEDARTVATALVNAYAGKMDARQPEKSSVLVYFSNEEVERIVSALLDNWDAVHAGAGKGAAPADLVKELVKETGDRTSAPDIALFGRMLAEKPELNIDAACQVAHAISTHRVSMEMDFYTAVDDLKPDDTAGADMLGTIEFNSACFYRYSNVDLAQLRENLGSDEDLARQTLRAFVRASILAIPSGKQNSMAAHNPPSLVLAVARESGPWNLANAFVRPVWPGRDGDLVGLSVKALDGYWQKLTTMYGTSGIVGRWLCTTEPDSLNVLRGALVENVDALVEQVLGAASFGQRGRAAAS